LQAKRSNPELSKDSGLLRRWYERENFMLEKEEVDPTRGRMMKYYRWKREAHA